MSGPRHPPLHAYWLAAPSRVQSSPFSSIKSESGTESDTAAVACERGKIASTGYPRPRGCSTPSGQRKKSSLCCGYLQQASEMFIENSEMGLYTHGNKLVMDHGHGQVRVHGIYYGHRNHHDYSHDHSHDFRREYHRGHGNIHGYGRMSWL